MMANRVFMSPYQFGYIDGLDYALSLMSEMFLGRESGAKATFYASVFQAGVDQLLVPDALMKKLPDTSFVTKRAQAIEPQETVEDYMLIHEMFSKYLPENYLSDEKFQDVWSLENLLAEFCICLRFNVSLLFPGPIPEPESLQGILPPELLLPATRLLSAIRMLPAAGPLPRYEIPKTDVRIYDEIVRSGLFHEFSEAHVPLSDQETAIDTALDQVRYTAAQLQENYLSELRLVHIGVSLLPLVPKLIDETIGKFPGKIAEHFSRLAEPFLKNRMRLVIYDSSQIHIDMFRAAMSYVAKNRDDDDVVKARLDRREIKTLERFAEDNARRGDAEGDS